MKINIVVLFIFIKILKFPKMERSPVITPLFHLRILSLIGLLIVLDLNFVHIAYNHTLVKGASVQLVFGFEVIFCYRHDKINLSFILKINFHLLK